MSGSGKSYDDKVKKNKGLESDRVAREGLSRRQELSRILHAQGDWIPGVWGRRNFWAEDAMGAKTLSQEPMSQGLGKARMQLRLKSESGE